MAGDHKCPVCSSTFTRPQHVARHMRSHTGDRPYKCNHCGDQFARSDLLSRHVNKCHASEKPPTTTQPARRKGHAQPGSSSAGGVRGPAPPLIPPPGSRKICDPCAHSRTPAQCDSGLPCGKCLQRNTKCTYLKANDAPASTSVVSLPRPPDLFQPATVPSMAGPPPPRPADSLFPSQPSFNFTVPLYPQSLDPRVARPPHLAYDSPQPPSLSLSASTSESVESSTPDDRAYHDMLRQCMFQPGPPPPAVVPTAGAFPDPARKQQQQQQQQQQPLPAPADPYMYSAADLPSFLYQPQQDLLPQQQHGFDPADLLYDPHAQPRVVASGFALPTQAPAVAHGQPQPQPAQGLPQQFARPPGFDAPHERGFSNAFGLMSLDDPAVAAEMSKSNSFFAPGALEPKRIPPTPGQTQGQRDANITELRDFWKAFMRDHTPGELPKTPGFTNGAEHPGLRRSLSKMASLPDIKTPPGNAVAPGWPSTGTGAEDLRSYEQAVLARKTPSLTLVPPSSRRARAQDDPSAQQAQQGQGQVERPSFKRLASQTLGPFESKSAKISHSHAEQGQAQLQHARSPSGEYPPVLHEQQRHRDRRLSAPTSSATRPAFDFALD